MGHDHAGGGAYAIRIFSHNFAYFFAYFGSLPLCKLHCVCYCLSWSHCLFGCVFSEVQGIITQSITTAGVTRCGHTHVLHSAYRSQFALCRRDQPSDRTLVLGGEFPKHNCVRLQDGHHRVIAQKLRGERVLNPANLSDMSTSLADYPLLGLQGVPNVQEDWNVYTRTEKRDIHGVQLHGVCPIGAPS